MWCPLRILRSLPPISFISAALLWGCAQSGEIDESFGYDPTLPEGQKPDASGDPSVKIPGSRNDDASSSTDGNDDENGPEAPDSGAPPVDPAAGGKPKQGEVLITEVMYDPTTAEPATEWIEVHNTAPSARTLSGLKIVDGANREHVIGAGVSIAAGEYVVLAQSKAGALAAKLPASVVVYEYGSTNPSIQLANGASGAVWLRDGNTTIARAEYGGWYTQAGSSIQLRTMTFAAGAQKSAWCLSSNSWAPNSDDGTPGAPNDCP